MVELVLKNADKPTPYPLVSVLGAVVVLINVTDGVYLLVMDIDKGAERRDVQNCYKLLIGFTGVEFQYLHYRLPVQSLCHFCCADDIPNSGPFGNDSCSQTILR